MKNKYIIFETQTNADNTIGTLVYDADDLATAQSIYYSKLSAAAISAIPVHSVALMTNELIMIDSKFFKHNIPETYSEDNQ